MIQTKQLPKEWIDFLGPAKVENLMAPVNQFLASQVRQKKTIYPPREQIFRAFELCAPSECRCIILGQDPYHGPGQAHGLAFSVSGEQKLPPSLKNIFKEYQDDLGLPLPIAGDLSAWAREGVLLLNTVLSVEAQRPASHFKQGWENFSDYIIESLADKGAAKAFVLWGAPSQKKKGLIKRADHLILEAPHPSPLSSYRGFFGSRPFSKINQFLSDQGQAKINWKLD